VASPKSIVNESRQIERAIALIRMGARLQVLESETSLSYERLLRLYKEVAGKSPSKGQLPFSTDWFLTWQPNIHSSLFLNTYEYLTKVSAMEDIDAVMKAFKLYLEQIASCDVEPLAAGKVRQQQHADHDTLLEMRRPLCDRALREHAPFRVWPV
jgi:flagellar transcriptional activator FlhC